MGKHTVFDESALFWISVILLLVLGVQIRTFLSWFLTKFKRVKAGPVELEAFDSTRSQEQLEDQEGAPCHRSCARVGEIYLLMEVFAQYLEKIFEVKDQASTTREQMRFAVLQTNLMLGAYSEKLVEVVHNLGVEKPLLHPVYRDYYAFGRLIMFETLEQLRSICNENHLASKSEKEFVEFTETKAESLLVFVQTQSKHYMPESRSIDGYQAAMESLHTEIKEAAIEFLYEARKISTLRRDKLENLRNELKDKVSKIMEGTYAN